MNKTLFFFLLFFANLCNGQSEINNYKYAIVPSKFDFLKENDQFRLNTLTKLFMEKFGFKTYFDSEEQPADAVNNNNLYVFVENTGGFINTNIKIILKNYKGTTLYASEIGKSKEKEFHLAYNEAFRKAFKSFETLNYSYNPKENNATKIQNPVESMTQKMEINSYILFAQPTITGFQLVDSSPKVVMKIFKTSSPNCFIAINEVVQGLLLSKDEQWFFEYYNNETLISNKIEVKF